MQDVSTLRPSQSVSQHASLTPCPCRSRYCEGEGNGVPANVSLSRAVPCQPDPKSHTHHMLVTKTLAPVRLQWLYAVAICLAPVAPSGWPNAMAPPFGLTLSMGILSFSTEYTACDANASLLRTGVGQPIMHSIECRGADSHLEEVDLLLGDAGLLERLGDGKGGSDTHDLGCGAGRRVRVSLNVRQ